MIYIDTSVALAHLLAEDRRPSPSLWRETVFTSRLLEYEVWTRINARGLNVSHGETVRNFLAHLAFVELERPILTRALEPYPVVVRTLDALHLASMDFLRVQGQKVVLASYDGRMVTAARQMGFALADV